ncbi:hypothetical protein Tco_0939266 [Tanacetum coccineum]|uniref:Uncharacterized protein n=1 Tax=Tanacetum coccineum TaxID=301880 RepID=A0ABQ5DJL5_9ASTR
MASQDARLAKFKADFKQQQSEMTNKIDTVLKAITGFAQGDALNTRGAPCAIKGVLRIQQYLQYEHYALWEVIEFGDSYKAPLEETDKGVTGEGSAKNKGRTMAITVEDVQKRRNGVKARTTLLLALPDENQLRLSKYDNAKEQWEAILKTFGGNEATKKTKKNQLNQQYGNFKAEGSETLEQTFNRLQAIVSHLELMDVPIEQDDLN